MPAVLANAYQLSENWCNKQLFLSHNFPAYSSQVSGIPGPPISIPNHQFPLCSGRQGKRKGEAAFFVVRRRKYIDGGFSAIYIRLVSRPLTWWINLQLWSLLSVDTTEPSLSMFLLCTYCSVQCCVYIPAAYVCKLIECYVSMLHEDFVPFL